MVTRRLASSMVRLYMDQGFRPCSNARRWYREVVEFHAPCGQQWQPGLLVFENGRAIVPLRCSARFFGEFSLRRSRFKLRPVVLGDVILPGDVDRVNPSVSCPSPPRRIRTPHACEPHTKGHHSGAVVLLFSCRSHVHCISSGELIRQGVRLVQKVTFRS